MKHKSILTIAVVFAILITVAGTASAKSLYVASSHSTKAFDAYDIAADGTISYQATYTLVVSSAPAGVAVDDVAKALFITSESSNKIEIVDGLTMTSPGYATASGASDLAGIDVDDSTHIVYTMPRGTNKVYAFQYDSTTKTLIPVGGFPKTLTTGMAAWGIALDDINNVLYIADSPNGKIRGFDTSGWSEVFTNTPSQKPTGIAVDRKSGFIYTTAPDSSCAYATSGIKRLVKTKIADGSETFITMDHGGMGIAVDEITGYVYLTEGCSGDDLSVWNTATSPFTSIEVQDLGTTSPAGLAIPQTDWGFDKLNLAKTDGVTQAKQGDILTYTISYTNTNPTSVTNVVITDTLPAGVSFDSVSLGGTYDSINHKVTWNIGTVAAGASGSVWVKVKVVATGGTITNYATIDSSETEPATKYDQTDIVTNGEIPEFPTIALPIAAILGLMFLLRRKD